MQSYLAPDVRPTNGEHHTIHVRGAAVEAPFVEAPRPTGECTPAALEARAAANQALSSVLYDGAEEIRAL